jgi:hypothetical protein
MTTCNIPSPLSQFFAFYLPSAGVILSHFRRIHCSSRVRWQESFVVSRKRWISSTSGNANLLHIIDASSILDSPSLKYLIGAFFRGHVAEYCQKYCDPWKIPELNGVNTPICEQAIFCLHKFSIHPPFTNLLLISFLSYYKVRGATRPIV